MAANGDFIMQLPLSAPIPNTMKLLPICRWVSFQVAMPNNRVKRDRRNAGFGLCQRLRAGPLP